MRTCEAHSQQPGHLTYDDQVQEEAEGGVPGFTGRVRHLQPGRWACLISATISIPFLCISFSAKPGLAAISSGFTYGAHSAELWFTVGANS